MFQGWDILLANWIDSVRDKPFSWGPHDCITFANNAAIKMRGFGFADEFIEGYSTKKGAMVRYRRFLEESGYSDLTEGLDDRLTRLKTNYAPRGSIVALPQEGVLPFAFGVQIGKYCAFVGDNGLLLLYPEPNFLYWGLK